MNIFSLLIFIMFSLFKTTLGAQLPSDIEKCHFGDRKCLIRSMNDLIRRYSKGIPEIGLQPLDVSTQKDSTVLEEGNDPPIWLSFHLTDNLYKGYNNATITEVLGFDRDPTKHQLLIRARIPSLIHEATYRMQGRYLVFRANTTGKLHSDFQNFQLTLKFKIIQEYRNNKRYLKIYELVPKVELDRWIISLENLYKENLDLTIALNRVMNDNWVEFWNGLEPNIMNNFAICFTDILNKVFEIVAYDDMFLPDKYGHEETID